MDSLVDEYGYDDRLFLAEVPEYLRCIVCTLVLRDPVLVLSCGHKYCKVCFARLRDRARSTGTELLCPQDRQVVDISGVHPDLAMKRVIGNLQVKCLEEENGCSWIGDLSELDTHLEKCELRKPDVSMIAEVTLKKMNERLEQCEASLFGKDKEIASLNYKLRQQEQKTRELEQQQDQLQQQHQKEINLMRANLKQQMQELKDEMTSLTRNLQCACAAPVNTHPRNDNSSSKKKAVVLKKVPVKHHRGKRCNVTVAEDFHQVEFGDLSTVSAPTALVPRGVRVWYEVYFHPGRCRGDQQIGWSTPNLPTSEEHTGIGVGDEKDSYGFDPFNGIRNHGRCTKWGKTLPIHEGGYMGVGLDTVNGEVLFSVNGDWTTPMGVAFTGVDITTPLFPAMSGKYSTIEINFGDRDFKYGPPTSNFNKLIDVLS